METKVSVISKGVNVSPSYFNPHSHQSGSPKQTSPFLSIFAHKYSIYFLMAFLFSFNISILSENLYKRSTTSTSAISHAGPFPHSNPQPLVGTIPGNAPSVCWAYLTFLNHSLKLLTQSKL